MFKRKMLSAITIGFILFNWSVFAAEPTKDQCKEAMSFLGFNITAVSKCNGIVKQSDLPDYSGAVRECNLAYGENYVTEATKEGIKKFKKYMQEHGSKKGCTKIQEALKNY